VRAAVPIHPFALSIALLFAAGCASSSQHVTEAAVFAESQNLFQQYLQADLPGARHALQQEIALLEDPPVVLQLERRATALFVECARLYTLEKRAGREADAERALTKARYWNLRRYEAASAMTDKGLDEMRSFSPERLIEIIDKSDKTHTEGKGPKYAQKN
jgi:hypothetical protein